MPVLGICAGMILLSKTVQDKVARNRMIVVDWFRPQRQIGQPRKISERKFSATDSMTSKLPGPGVGA